MIEFGKTLRAARESKGLEPGQIAERTHMMTQVVEGLENEDFSKIVAPIYGRGFVKLYCEAVGLDPKPLVEAFMEIYNRGTCAAAPAPAPAPAAASASPAKPAEDRRDAPVRAVASEQPAKVQTAMDFGAPAGGAPEMPPPSASRYAAPMPMDDGFSIPFVNWRLVMLCAAAAAIVVIAFVGVRALYRVTMTSPADGQTEEAAATEPEQPSAEVQPPAGAKATEGRKPLPLKPFYIDSNHQTEMEK